MYVRPGCRRAGIGVALLAALTAYARERGLRALRLETGIAQAEALALYERAGFADTGRRDVLPSNPALQTIQMALNLRGDS